MTQASRASGSAWQRRKAWGKKCRNILLKHLLNSLSIITNIFHHSLISTVFQSFFNYFCGHQPHTLHAIMCIFCVLHVEVISFSQQKKHLTLKRQLKTWELNKIKATLSNISDIKVTESHLFFKRSAPPPPTPPKASNLLFDQKAFRYKDSRAFCLFQGHIDTITTP